MVGVPRLGRLLGTNGGPVVSVRPDAGQRLLRLLAVLTWLARRGRAPLAELAEQFSLSPEELVADLELAACCGLPPYTPDQLMEIIVDDEEVVANLGPELARPRRLTAAEGFGLAASARAIAAVPGADPDGALARALAKLEAVLGDGGGLSVDLGEPPNLGALRRAIEAGQQVELSYYSLSSDEESLRVVDPAWVVAIDGKWYLDGYCHRAGGTRRFRVDRVLSVRLTGEHVAGAPVVPSGTEGAFVPGPEATVARLAVESAGMWVIDAAPTISQTPLADGRTEVRLGVASMQWFGRLLLRLGPHAQVLDPPELTTLGSDLAARLLERYQTSN